MVNISSGLNRRGHRELYDGRFDKAVEYFFKAHLSGGDTANTMDLIYALNQNADYIRALEFCYALLGKGVSEDRGMLYFLCAEAFGGAGSVEGCGQMLINSLKVEPDGRASEDARAFLKDLVQKYSVNEKNGFSEELTMGESNGITEAPFLSMDSYQCIVDISTLANEGKFDAALRRAEKEIENGNFSIAVLNAGIMLASETGDRRFLKRCAERFRFVEDYTLAEIRTLAYDMTVLNDDDAAYTVYKELYSKESGERDIAYAFAIACFRMGQKEYAREIMSGVASGAGGVGPAAHALNGMEEYNYSVHYSKKEEEEFTQILLSDEPLKKDPMFVEDLFEFARYSEYTNAFIDKADTTYVYYEFALRRLAIAPEVNLFMRAKAAQKLSESFDKVFLNTGTDIILYTGAVGSVITKFFERNFEK